MNTKLLHGIPMGFLPPCIPLVICDSVSSVVCCFVVRSSISVPSDSSILKQR